MKGIIAIGVLVLIITSVIVYTIYSKDEEFNLGIDKVGEISPRESKSLVNIEERKGDVNFHSGEDGLVRINGVSSNFFLGFAITGSVDGADYLIRTDNYNWVWEKESYNETRIRYNESLGETEDRIFTIDKLIGISDNTELTWKQELIFDPERPMKINHTITNNLGRDITNVKYWFIFELGEDFKFEHGGIEYNTNRQERRTRDIQNEIPIIDFGEVEFRYDDLINNSFTITDIYSGDGEVVGRGGTYIGGLGITKGNLLSGENINIDPEVTDYKSPSRAGQHFNQWTNGNNILTSNDAYTTETTIGEQLGTDLYGLEEVIPNDAEIVGIEIQVEGQSFLFGC